MNHVIFIMRVPGSTGGARQLAQVKPPKAKRAHQARTAVLSLKSSSVVVSRHCQVMILSRPI